MDGIERYIYRVEKKGATATEFSMNMSKQITSNLFTTSPSYKSVLLNNVLTDAIVYDQTNYNEKSIIFKPDTKVNIGSVVVIGDKTYLLMSFFDKELDPKGELVLCNESLLLSGEPEEVQIGIDPYTSQPVFDYTDGLPISHPCIVTMTMANENLANQPIAINNDTIRVTLPYFDFKESQIELYDETYQVKSIDKTKVINGVGLLTILGEKV